MFNVSPEWIVKKSSFCIRNSIKIGYTSNSERAFSLFTDSPSAIFSV